LWSRWVSGLAAIDGCRGGGRLPAAALRGSRSATSSVSRPCRLLLELRRDPWPARIRDFRHGRVCATPHAPTIGDRWEASSRCSGSIPCSVREARGRIQKSSEMLPRFGSSADFFGLFTRIASISRDFRLPFVMSRDMSHRSRLFGWLPHPNFPIWTSSGYARAFMLVSPRQTLPTSSASTAGQFGADSTSSNEPRLNAPGT
jgi:hypothetical protein